MADYIITYEVKGRLVTCPQCGHEHFSEGSAQLNTAGMTFLGLDWADRSATILICKQCGRIEWYMQRPTVIRRSPLSGALTP